MDLPDNGKERKAILLCPYYVLSIVLGHGQMEIASDLLALVFLAKEEREKKNSLVFYDSRFGCWNTDSKKMFPHLS